MKKKIGKLFVIGYMGDAPDAEFLDFVSEWGIGGVIVFARNLKNTDNLCENLMKIQKAAGDKIFTAIDQEGGLVLRILKGGSLFPSAMALTATGDVELTEDIYQALGSEMKSFGLNWNLAPVLDINHQDNPGIGARSFGETPEIVSKFGTAAIKGLNKSGVLACAKHFPGKGHAKVDSHLTLPIILYSEEHLENFELIPFKKAIDTGIGAIMTSHVFFPAYESEPNLPATLSKSVLTGLLRNKLGFNGLLITDDLEMGAITETFGVAEASLKAFYAGADQLLICHSLEKQRLAAEAVLERVQNDSLALERLEESLERIESAKNDISFIEPGKKKNLVKKHQTLIERAYEKSIKFLRIETDRFPLDEERKIIFVCPKISALVQVEELHEEFGLGNEILKFYHDAEIIQYDPAKCTEEISDRLANEIDSEVVFFTYNAHLFEGQRKVVNSLLKKLKTLIVVALRNPYDLSCFGESENCCATFGFRSPAIVALMKTFKGELKPDLSGWPVIAFDESLNSVK